MRIIRSLRTLAPAALLVAAPATPAAALAQLVPPTQQAAPTTLSANKLVAVSLSVDPSPVAAGRLTTVRFTVKNVAAVALSNVPWTISAGAQQIGAGTIPSMAAGSSTIVTASWTPSAGTVELRGLVDPAFTLGEGMLQARGDNSVRLAVAVPTPSAATAGGDAPVEMETQLLNYDQAKNYGAHFVNAEDRPGTCAELGVQAPASTLGGQTYSLVFAANCQLSLVGNGASPRAFADFRLRHGWRVKSFEPPTVMLGPGSSGARWEWIQTPRVGTDDPSMSMRVSAQPGVYLWVWVKVFIEGPKGTSPYAP